jgi:hypothetical protein
MTVLNFLRRSSCYAINEYCLRIMPRSTLLHLVSSRASALFVIAAY